MSKIKNELKDDPLMPLRHSAEHVLHTVMEKMYPGLLKAMGPPVENGFYFDFHYEGTVSAEDFGKIEEEMQKLIDLDLPFKMSEMSVEEAKKVFKNNPYKQEWIKDIKDRNEKITVVEMGDKNSKYYDIDICAGPHLKSTGQVKAFKLLSVAGAYWRGDENNEMLTRIYATAFDSKEKLEEYLQKLEEAKKRDHRKLGKELGLIVFSDLIGAGLPMYTPKGALLRSLVYDYSRELNEKIGYKETALPNMNRGELFKVSGHYEKYHDDMFEVHSHYSKDEFFLKPMNCPQHCVLFGSDLRSYRDLPIRYSDFSMLYRDEKPGELNGLLRTRSFAQDDGHCFCRDDQIEEELNNVIDIIIEALDTYGFKEYWIRLSLSDPAHMEKYLGDRQVWDRAEDRMKKIVQKRKDISFVEAVGEAAIYGPKLDFMIKDSLGREWQLSTAQLDLIMSERFGLKYVDSDGSEKTPTMIHRAIVGSERFLAVLLEHFAGAFPVWLMPTQAVIIPINEKSISYAETIKKDLQSKDIRTEINDRPDTMQAKIRAAQLEKIPYMLVIGDKEVESGKISVRLRNKEDLGAITANEFSEKVNEIIKNKSLDLW